MFIYKVWIEILNKFWISQCVIEDKRLGYFLPKFNFLNFLKIGYAQCCTYEVKQRCTLSFMLIVYCSTMMVEWILKICNFHTKNENLSKISSLVFMKIGTLHNVKQPCILLFILFKNAWSQNWIFKICDFRTKNRDFTPK